MNKKKKRYITIIAVAVIVVIIIGFVAHPGKPAEIVIQTDYVHRADISNTVTATGTIEASFTVDVGTQVSGKIKKLNADFNSKVRKGQLLAVLDTETLESTLESSKASLDLAQAEFNFQKSNYDRNKKLIEKNLIAQTDFDQIEFNYKSALANLNSAKAKYNKDKTNLAYAYIYSPIDGVVLEKKVEEGETVAASFETPTLFTIAKDLTQMEIEADVDEADIGQLKTDQRVEFTVDAYPDKVFEGMVTEIHLMPVTNSNVITYTVIINAPNPEQILMPGMTANVSFFVTEKKDILVVPNKAIEFVPDNDVAELYQKVHPEIQFRLQPDRPEEGPNNMSGKIPGDSPKNTVSTMPERKTDIAEPNNPDQLKMIWVKEENTISPKMIEVGQTDEINYEVISGIVEGEEVITSMISPSYEIKNTGNAQGGSPFMPKPPGRNKK